MVNPINKITEFIQNVRSRSFDGDNESFNSIRTTGLLAALVVLLLFIVAAIWLKTVFFGFLFAYIFLPLEKFYEKHIFSNRVYLAVETGIAFIFLPLKKIRALLMKKNQSDTETVSETQKKADSLKQQHNMLAGKASALTVFTIFTVIVMGIYFGISILVPYATSQGASMIEWAKKNEVITKLEQSVDKVLGQQKGVPANPETAQEQSLQAPPDNSGSGMQAANVPAAKDAGKKLHSKATAANLETKQQTQQPQSHSGFRDELAVLLQYLDQSTLAGLAVNNGTDLVSYIAGIISSVGVFAFDFFMFLFFFFFFLQRMAVFRLSADTGASEKEGLGQWTVKNVMESGWFPGISQKASQSAAMVLDRIYRMFDAWLRGYFWIIAIEITLYEIFFYFFQVPYAFPLGIVAGLTILLPYLGPLLSILLTSAVTLCFAPAGELAIPLLGIILAYSLVNGVLEQLFLYPTLVGEAIGLTTLETIIVVLLGAVIADITGMILAVPVAALLKFIIPLFYTAFRSPSAEISGNPEQKTTDENKQNA